MRRLRPLTPPRRVSLARADWLIALALCLLGLVVVTCVTSQVREGRWAVAGDAHYVFATGRSIAYDGDLDLANQLDAMGDRYGFAQRRAADGFVPPPREIGASLGMVPGLWLHRITRAPEHLEPTFASLVPALAMGVVYALLVAGLGITAPDTRSEVRRRISVAAILGGVLPFYAMVSVGYTHAADAIVCAALTLALLRDPHLGRPLLLGGLLAAAVLVRLQNALWLAWPAVALALDAGTLTREARRKRVVGLVSCAAVGSLGCAPMLGVDALHPGSPGGAIRWDLEFFHPAAVFEGMASVVWGRHGLWSWTPLCLLGCLGLAVHRDRLPALAVLIVMVVLMAVSDDPEAGTAFGARRLCGLTMLCGLGLAEMWSVAAASWGRLPHGFRLAIAACVVSNLYRVGAAMLGLIRLS